MSKPEAFFSHLLAIDVETSGMCFGTDDPSHNPVTGEQYQIVSIGLVVADTTTLKPVEELYLEIKWNGTSKWDAKAQSVHGLSLKYLEDNGIDEEEAVVEIANLILKYWGPTSGISLLGHNVATFDLYFLKQLMRKYDIELQFSRRHIDSQTVGFTAFNAFTSDQLFEALGLPQRNGHNALQDAKHSLQAVRTVRALVKSVLGE